MSNMNKCKGMVSFLNCKFFYKKNTYFLSKRLIFIPFIIKSAEKR